AGAEPAAGLPAFFAFCRARPPPAPARRATLARERRPGSNAGSRRSAPARRAQAPVRRSPQALALAHRGGVAAPAVEQEVAVAVVGDTVQAGDRGQARVHAHGVAPTRVEAVAPVAGEQHAVAFE